MGANPANDQPYKMRSPYFEINGEFACLLFIFGKD
jgi:hypothetical protein